VSVLRGPDLESGWRLDFGLPPYNGSSRRRIASGDGQSPEGGNLPADLSKRASHPFTSARPRDESNFSVSIFGQAWFKGAEQKNRHLASAGKASLRHRPAPASSSHCRPGARRQQLPAWPRAHHRIGRPAPAARIRLPSRNTQLRYPWEPLHDAPERCSVSKSPARKRLRLATGSNDFVRFRTPGQAPNSRDQGPAGRGFSALTLCSGR
jgi:hypothetical protein